jgi:hypothetical protein
VKIQVLRVVLWMKTNLHPEALGGERRARPRRRTDRRKDTLRSVWLAGLTVVWVWMALSIRHDQSTIAHVARDNVLQRCELTRTLVGLARRGGPEFSAPLEHNYRACRKLLNTAKQTP